MASFISSDEDSSESQKTGNSYIWVEKYRPKELDDYIGNSYLVQNVKQHLVDGDIPNLLFHGTAGTGKTTLARIITSKIKCDVLEINASIQNSVDTVRETLTTFVHSAGFSGKKIVILDEFDYFSINAQAALRNLIESTETTRFILTCNNVNKIMDAIASRCQTYNITPPTKADVAKTVKRILDEEGKVYDINDIVGIVNAKYPDIRSVIQLAQQYSKIDNKLIIPPTASSDTKSSIDELVVILQNAGPGKSKDKVFAEIRQLIVDAKIKNFAPVYQGLFDNIDKYATGPLIGVVIMYIADAQYQEAFVLNKDITFLSAIYKIIGDIYESKK